MFFYFILQLLDRGNPCYPVQLLTVVVLEIYLAQHSFLRVMYVLYMYICMVMTYYSTLVWIDRVRLPILLVVSWTGEMDTSLSSPFAPEDLILRDGFDRPVPRQLAHSPHSG